MLALRLAILKLAGLAVLVSSCGAPSVVGTDATVQDADDSDALQREDSFFIPAEAFPDDDEAAPDVNPYEGYDVIDGGPLADGNWTPCNFIRIGETHGCCNGELCQGFCEALDEGGARCSCFGIIGGCGTFGVQAYCCTRGRGCQGEPCGPGGK